MCFFIIAMWNIQNSSTLSAICPLFSLFCTTETPCCAYWNLGSQLPYRPITEAFTKAPANWISATFPCQMRL